MKVYVSDMDGTLLSRQGLLSKETRQGLEGLLAAGLPFTIASARAFHAIAKVIGDLELSLPVIAYNGALICKYPGGEKIMVRSLSKEVIQKTMELLKERGLSPLVSIYEGDQDYLLYQEETLSKGARAYIEFRQALEDERLRPVEEFDLSEKEVLCINAISELEEVRSAYKELKAHFGDFIENHYMEGAPGDFWLNVAHRESTKGGALRFLKNQYLPKEARLIAFGDNENDLGMFEEADVAIATQNATDRLKKRADRLIGHHDDDSVIKYLKEDYHEAD